MTSGAPPSTDETTLFGLDSADKIDGEDDLLTAATQEFAANEGLDFFGRCLGGGQAPAALTREEVDRLHARASTCCSSTCSSGARIRSCWSAVRTARPPRSRLGTAAAISRESFDTAGTVFLARADDYADALAVAALAYTKGSPVLLVPPDRVPRAVDYALALAGAERVVLIGGPGAIRPTSSASSPAGGR